MSNTTVTKVDSEHAPRGEMGQRYLASGKSIAMRLWDETPVTDPKPPTTRDYETVGYVLAGSAELHIDENPAVLLKTGDSWVVPQGASHTYKVLEPFTAVEATSPPAQMDGRDKP